MTQPRTSLRLPTTPAAQPPAPRAGSLRSPLLVVTLAALVGGCGLFGGTPTASPVPAATATQAPSATQAPTPTTAPTATASPTLGPCDPTQLVARITAWEGATGHRIATVEMTNTASAACQVAALLIPQLVDGSGAVLIDGTPPATAALLTVGPGGVLTTLVQDGNYCGPAPVAPVTVAFVFPGGLGRIVATPLSAADTSGVPPCLGSPGSPGDIEMQPWAP
jgi:hypothetical protein